MRIVGHRWGGVRRSRDPSMIPWLGVLAVAAVFFFLLLMVN
jgi:hypothetical protein